MKKPFILCLFSLFSCVAYTQNTTQSSLKLTGTDLVGSHLPLQIDDNPTGLTFNTNTWGRQIRLSRLDNTYHYDIGLDGSNEFYIMKRNSLDVAFKINATGNIGIGTATPMGKLDVRGGFNLNRPTLFQDDMSAVGIPAGSYLGIVPSDISTSNNGYMLFSFPDNNTFRIGTGYDGHLGIGTFRDIQFGRYTDPYLTIKDGGNIGIGTTAPGNYKLAVEGKIGAREVKVTLASWADYVFNKEYKLMSLASLETFIKKNNHLPNIPSAQEVKDNGGIDLGEMNRKLLEKIEELTLYVIELKKENEAIKEEVKELAARQQTSKQQ